MGTKYGGYMGRYLDINLSTGEVRDYDVSDEDRELYLGSKGLGARILYDCTRKGVDPLGPENVLIVNTGPLVGSSAPCTSRFNVSTKSPLTGAVLSSNCGGNFGIHLKRAGVDGIIVRGKANKPTRIHISDGKVEFLDASDLWGMDTEETQEKLPAKVGKIVIGPAGENGVLFANIISQERAAGRGGAGAVMGSKNLKAITASGKEKVPVARQAEFEKDVKKWISILRAHPTTGETLPAYGTGVFVNRCNATNTLPTHNFKQGSFDEADAVSGETLADTMLEKNFGCVSCVIKCGRRVKVEGKEVKGPEYETLGLLGPNLENPDLERICEWNYLADLMGMDTVSLGNVLGFAMELNERGLWKSGLSFGKTDGIAAAIESIARREGIGDELALGVRHLSEKYGGREFAMHSKGMEFPSYEPRGAVGHGLGYAISNRGGCHLGGGYFIYFEATGPITMDPHTTHSKPEFVAMFQTLLDAVSSAGNCQFTSFALIPKQALNLKPYGAIYKAISNVMEGAGPILKLVLKHPGMLPYTLPVELIPHPKVISDLTGMRMTIGNFLAAGLRSYLIERMFNVREGFAKRDDSLPERVTREGQGGNPKWVVSLDKMLPRYYDVRGLDERGIPKPQTLFRLGVKV